MASHKAAASILPPGNAPTKKRTRKRHRKSRLGCPQCKKRKVKCDESLPSCLNCIAKDMKCSYVDYTAEQILKIEEAHQAAEAEARNRTIVPGIASPGSRQVSNDLNTPSSSSYPNQESPATTASFETEHSIKYSSDLQRILNQSVQGFHILKQVKHAVKEPKIDMAKHPEFFTESIKAFLARAFVRTSNHEVIIAAAKDLRGFYGNVMLMCGVFLRRHPELETMFLDIRGKCIKMTIDGIQDLNDSNAYHIQKLSIGLDVSSVYLSEDANHNFRQYFKFSTGPLSILRKLYENPSAFPKSYPILKQYADAMLYSTKLVWIPQYNIGALYELYDVVTEFGSKYIDTDTNKNQVIREQYGDMIDLMNYCLDLFSNYKSNDLVLRYPIEKLYILFQRWFRVFPSEYCVLDSPNMTSVEKVFYVMWFALLKILEAMIINCRYVFSFFLDGYFLVHVFQREDIEKTLNRDGNDELKECFSYCARIISFFNRRSVYVLKNTIFTDRFPQFLHLKDRLKARPLDIHERCITSFKDTVIKKIHYPTESSRTTAFKSTSELVSYYMSSDRPVSGSDEEDDGLTEFFKGLDPKEEEETVDLLNNVNPLTSMLNNDYDPRLNDPIFDDFKLTVLHQADLDFFDKYIEDRKLIVKLLNDGYEDDYSERSDDDDGDNVDGDDVDSDDD